MVISEREESKKDPKRGKKHEDLELIERGCPLCKSDVKGDDKNKFYCKKCNMLFSRKGLSIEPHEDNDNPEQSKEPGVSEDYKDYL